MKKNRLNNLKLLKKDMNLNFVLLNSATKAKLSCTDILQYYIL